MSAMTRAASSPILRFPSRAACSVLARLSLSLLAQKNARGRIVKVGDVRQAGIRHGAAEGDEVSRAARAFSIHDWPYHITR